MLNKKRLQKQLVFALLFLLAIGVVITLLSSYSAGETEDHIVYQTASEQIVQVENRSNKNTIMKFFNGKLVDEQLQQLENLTVKTPKD